MVISWKHMFGESNQKTQKFVHEKFKKCDVVYSKVIIPWPRPRFHAGGVNLVIPEPNQNFVSRFFFFKKKLKQRWFGRKSNQVLIGLTRHAGSIPIQFNLKPSPGRRVIKLTHQARLGLITQIYSSIVNCCEKFGMILL
jgi:hypothetical protein